jgi:hypothetical protein
VRAPELDQDPTGAAGARAGADYQGIDGFDGICHVRVYEQDGRLPVVIVGQLEDNPGTSISNAIEMVA